MDRDPGAPAQTRSALPTRTPSLLVPAAATLWLALGATAQWAPDFAARIQYSKALGLLGMALLLPVTTALGRRLLRCLRLTFVGTVEELVASAALGLGALAYLVLLLAALQVLQPVVIAALLAALTGAFGAEAIGLSRRCAQAAASATREALGDPMARFAACLVVAGCLVALVGALAPATDNDTLRYHFAAPARYVQHGGFVDIPTNVFANFPFTIEMLFTIGLALRVHMLAKLVTLVLWGLTGLAVWGIARQMMSTRAAWLALATWCTIPLGLILCATGTVEHGLAIFELLALWGVINWRVRSERGWLWLAAVFAGLALGSKYGAALSLLILVFLVVAGAARAGRRRRGILGPVLHGMAMAALFVLIAIAVLSPWLVKNLMFTGDPVFPFAGSVFPTPNWPTECTQKYLEHVRSLTPHVRTPQGLVTLAHKLAFDPQSLGSAAGIGAVFLIFCPLSLLFRPTGRPALAVIVYALLAYIAWALTGPVERFLVPVLPCASLIVGLSFDRLQNVRHMSMPVRVALLVLLATGLASAVSVQAQHFSPYRLVIGAEDVEYYLSRTVTYYPAAAYCNRELPRDAKVLFVGETRTLYFEREVVADTGFNPTVITGIAEQTRTPEEIVQQLRQRGFTHLLVNWSTAMWLNQELGYWKMTSAAHQRLSGFLREQVRLVFEANDIQVFEIAPPESVGVTGDHGGSLPGGVT